MWLAQVPGGMLHLDGSNRQENSETVPPSSEDAEQAQDPTELRPPRQTPTGFFFTGVFSHLKAHVVSITVSI